MLNASPGHWLGRCQQNVQPQGRPQWCCQRPMQRRVRAPFTRVAAAGHSASGTPPSGAQAVLDRYRAMLHEYRLHKSALGDWVRHITASKQRPPQLLDAEATGDAMLVGKFQQYLMVRKRLLAEIPLLREQLHEAIQQENQLSSCAATSTSSSKSSSSSIKHSARHGNAVNANQSLPVSKSQAVGQFFSAVNYRQQHGVKPNSSTSSSSSGSSSLAASTVTAAGPDGHDSAAQQQSKLQPVVHTVAAPAQIAGSTSQQHNSSKGAVSSTNSSSSSSRNDSNVSHLLTSATQASSSNTSPTSSSRATAAALAALAYKKQKQTCRSKCIPGEPPLSISSGSNYGKRPLAVLLAESPAPPPSYAAAAAGASSSVNGRQQPATASSPGEPEILAAVETAKGDVYAGRMQRQLDTDVSLEATLQGVPGGLGSSLDDPMFAVACSTADASSSSAGPESSSNSGFSVLQTAGTAMSSSNQAAEDARTRQSSRLATSGGNHQRQQQQQPADSIGGIGLPADMLPMPT